MHGMFPASFLVPGAVILVAGGALACFFGHRLFRVVLGIYGFILGAAIATQALGPTTAGSTLLVGLGAGAVGALVLILAYFVGVALFGAMLGALAANVIWTQLGTDPHPLVVIGFSIVGAIGALALQRYVIVLGTAFGGAWTMLVGTLALAGSVGAREAAARGDVWLLYPLDPAPGHAWVPFAWIALGVVGTAVQMGFTAKKRK
jgi:hypothetical protein